MTATSRPVLTPERRQVLRAVVERILPGTHGPGAARSDAAVGFERALGHAHLRGLRPGIEALLDRLQARAAAAHGQEFAACGAEERDELLRALEQDPATRVMFRMVIGLSLEGLLGDPRYGGNRDFTGWEAAGLAPAEVRAGLCRRAGAT